jgi:hypothetical protein
MTSHLSIEIDPPGSAVPHIDATPAEHALQVLARTASVWRIAPPTPQALARRAPHGHVPLRIMRRIQAAARASARPVLAHSW